MFKNKKLIIFPLIIFAVFICYMFLNYNNQEKIEKVLKKDYYSYLPAEAKDYIRQVYEDTGEIILTEKNKKENVQYLNPEYIEYLTYSEEEKKEVSIVPNELIIDYVSDSKKVTATNHESYYNIAEQGNNYVTPMKNQGSLGICWAYATIENAETFLMKSSDSQYEDGVSKVLSPRQLDYVTSSLGIEDYVNKYGDHTLGAGSNFQTATKALTDGISFYESSWKYNNSNSLNKLELSEVFNDSLSKFELNSTIEMPVLNVKNLDLSKQSDLNKYNEYIYKIKDLIKTYGGPYIASEAPGYSCSAINIQDDTHHIVDTDSACEKDGSHAMQIVGWDDNYNYKYCINGSKHKKWTNECSSQNTVTGTGAWIVRNSWGDNTNDKFTYLTYNSIDTEYDFITSLESSENKKWNYIFNTINNNMQISRDYNSNTNVYNYVLSFFPSFDVDSKIIKIKYRNTSQNNRYKVYISETGKDSDYTLVNDSTIDYPGYVTIDLSSENYRLTKHSKIKIVCNGSLMDRYFSVYTSEQTDTKYIITKDKIYEQSDDILENNLYKIHLFSNTYNIVPNSEIEYRLFDRNGNDITEEIEVENNTVSSNMINATLYLPNINNKSYYTVKTIYDGNVMSTSRLTVETPKPSIGSGTEEDPYVIMTPQDLYSINYNMDSHFVLGTDIDLTYDTQNENGLYYNSGNGWTAIGYAKREAFSGSINGYYNGKIHKIIGLKTNSIGFLFYVESGKKTVNLKNIIFENAIVNNSNLLASTIVGGNEGKVNIENIAAINSNFSNSSNLLAYNLKSYGKDSININSIFTDSSFNEGNSTISSLAWGADTYENYTTDASIKISNIQILGKINNNSSYYYTTLLRFATGNIDISNVIFNNYSNNTPYMFARLSQSSSGNKPSIKNIYYLNSVSTYYFSNSVYTEENVVQKTFSELKNESSYDNWDDFDNYWVMSNKDNIIRIPILKFISFQYTTINNINLNVGESVSIYDYISPTSIASHNMIFENLDDDKISLDTNGMVTGLNYGTASIHILSNYDGFDGNITINVLDDTKSIIRFNSEYGTLVDQIVTKSQTETLNENTFTKTGYKFKEWNTKADGSGTSYSDGQEVNLNDNLNLYAQWQPIKYQIKYFANNSQDSTAIQEVEYDSRVLLNENTFIHENDKYYFKEWNTKADGSGTSYQNEESIYNMTNVDGDVINLYAQWEVSKPVISFDANGGTGTMADLVIDLGETVSLTTNTFEKTGYWFGHWNSKSDDSGTSYYNGKQVSPTTDLKLYAIWYPINYSVFWYNEDQTKSKSATNTYDVEYTATDYKWTLKEGYKFKEWNTKADGSGTSYKAGDTFKNLTTIKNFTVRIYAIMLPIDYEISFNANGGTGTMEHKVLTYDLESNLTKNTFIREGYTFKEWNTKADGSGTSYSDEQSVKNLSSMENAVVDLYAQWEENNLEISFDANGGTGTMDKFYLKQNENKNLPLNTFTKIGYKFKEWNTKADGSETSYSDGQEVNLNDNLNVYAQWQPITYKIKFYANGGEGAPKEQEIQYDKATNLTKNTFTKSGYSFKEWNTELDGSGTSYSNEHEILNLSNSENQIIELYAQWNNASGTITYNSNDDNTQTQTQNVVFNTDINLMKNTFTREGYTFKEWNTKADGSGTSYNDEQQINISSNKTLYAQWQPITYALILNSNNGSYEMKQQVLTYDKSEKISKNTFIREGYTFKEWNTKADGSGTSYSDEQSVKNLSSTENAIVDLYVQWQESIDYVINNYDVDETNKYISKIMVNTEVNNFTSNIILGYGYGIDVDTKAINNKQLLYTGGKTRITHGLDLYREYTNIVIGDINGDGAINSADLLKIRQHLLGTNILTGTYFLSSDINYDSTINSADLLRIRQHLLGTKPIE